MRRFVAVGVAVLVLAACGPSENDVTRAGFEERGLTWPLTVDEVFLFCRDGVVRVSDDGNTYALSGGSDWPVLDEGSDLWADDPETGAKVPLTDLRDEGEQLCE